MSYKQDPPNSIQIELTKGCNLQCSFCGINGFQKKPNSCFEFMTLQTAKIIAEEIELSGWTSRLEFAMHGEPTMNPNWLEIIAMFRDVLPKHQIMMTSNGGGIVKGGKYKDIEQFFLLGGDILALDDYEGIKLVDKIRDNLDDFELECMGVDIHEYPADKEGNPHRRVGKKRFLTYIASIDVTDKGVHSKLLNHCGSAGKLDFSFNDKLCAKPFREMAFNWDGSVDICCNDFIGEYTCGQIYAEPIEDLWNNQAFASARKYLMARQRGSLRPCDGCNSTSFRVGLLPDRMGKSTLSEPTEEDRDIVEGVLCCGPSREPVGRAKVNIGERLYEDI